MATSKPTAFVLMPFAPDFNDIYARFFRPVLEDNGFEVRRADDLQSRQNILRAIVDGIATSDLIVADLTNTNPNVSYELGLAHALRKPVILVTQNIDEIPFDLKPYSHLEYGRDFTDMENARDVLAEKARAFHSGDLKFDSPITDFLPERSQLSNNDVAGE